MSTSPPNWSNNLLISVGLTTAAAVAAVLAGGLASGALLSLFGSGPRWEFLLPALVILLLSPATIGLLNRRSFAAAFGAGLVGLASAGGAVSLWMLILMPLDSFLPLSANGRIITAVAAGTACLVSVCHWLTIGRVRPRALRTAGCAALSLAAVVLIAGVRDVAARLLAPGLVVQTEQGLRVSVLIFAALTAALVAYRCNRGATGERFDRAAAWLVAGLGLLALLSASL